MQTSFHKLVIEQGRYMKIDKVTGLAIVVVLIHLKMKYFVGWNV